MDPLEVLAPSPISETPTPYEKTEYFSKHSISSSTSNRVGNGSSTGGSLGLSGHSTIWWLIRIQKYSSLAFTAFTALHFTNTALLPLLTRHLPTSDTYLLLTRPYYQSPLMEPLLIILPLTLHISSGILLRLVRRHRSLTSSPPPSSSFFSTLTTAWPPLSLISKSGYLLLPFLSGHILLNRLIPLIYDGGNSNVGLQYLAHAFARAPLASYAAYAGLVLVGVSHMVGGGAKYLGWDPAAVGGQGWDAKQKRKMRYMGVGGSVVVVAAVWMASVFGVVAGGGS